VTITSTTKDTTGNIIKKSDIVGDDKIVLKSTAPQLIVSPITIVPPALPNTPAVSVNSGQICGTDGVWFDPKANGRDLQGTAQCVERSNEGSCRNYGLWSDKDKKCYFPGEVIDQKTHTIVCDVTLT
jgi:hypothetical protein